MRKVILAMTLVSLFCISGTGLAQYDDRNSDLMAYAGLLHLDRGGGNEFTIGARYSYNFDVYNSAEFGFGYTFPENADVFLYYVNYRLNASLKENKVKPFFTLGIGAVSYVFDTELDLEVSSQALDGTSFTFNIGGGFQQFIAKNLTWRVDFRDIIIFFGDKTVEGITLDIGNTQNFEFTAGFSYYFI